MGPVKSQLSVGEEALAKFLRAQRIGGRREGSPSRFVQPTARLHCPPLWPTTRVAVSTGSRREMIPVPRPYASQRRQPCSKMHPGSNKGRSQYHRGTHRPPREHYPDDRPPLRGHGRQLPAHGGEIPGNGGKPEGHSGEPGGDQDPFAAALPGRNRAPGRRRLHRRNPRLLA